MDKKELLNELALARKELKDYNKFIDLLKDKDDPKGILTRLNKTLSNIDFLLKTSDVKELAHPKNDVLIKSMFAKKGALVKVRPCDEKYNNKTYLGFLIGELARGSSITIFEDKIQLNWSGYNPAIFVPELGEVIFGCSSWWGEIESEDDLNEISNDDIDNVWYVRLLKNIKNNK